MNVKTLGIIGYGDFGRLVHDITQRFFPNVNIRIYSRDIVPDGMLFCNIEDACTCDIVFLTVPIPAFEVVLEQCIPLIDKETIVVDVCTVKYYPAKVLAKHTDKIKYICTHPMFGPYSFAKIGHKLENLRIVLSDHNLDDETYTALLVLLNNFGLKILEINADKHDKKLAETLFLTHLIGQIVSKGDFVRTDIDTLSFGFIMDAVESVKHDTQLFRDVFAHNPYCQEVLERFDESYKSIVSQLK